ncbi:MAG TPA: hypothetical protein VG318_06775 [Actinomycetota bacterium]|nr:hypothetical protein [Actinomycetota bacterium]
MSRKLRALAGMALIVVGSFVVGPVAPAAAATSCLNVPAATPGFTVGIGGTPQRIPSFSGISVCASTPDGSPVAPVVSNAVGGACVASCTTVTLRVSPVDAGPVSVTYVQDGVTTRHSVDPEAVGASESVCLVSIGTPQAPDPGCALSLGSDRDLTNEAAALVSQVTTLVNQTISQVTTLVNQTITQAKPIVDDAVADATALSDQLGAQAWQSACWVVYWGNDPVSFCDDPVQWVQNDWEYVSNYYYEYLTEPGLVPRLVEDVQCRLSEACWGS